VAVLIQPFEFLSSTSQAIEKFTPSNQLNKFKIGQACIDDASNLFRKLQRTNYLPPKGFPSQPVRSRINVGAQLSDAVMKNGVKQWFCLEVALFQHS